MVYPHSQIQLKAIEIEVTEKIERGLSDGVKRKDVAQQVARDVFLAHYPEQASLASEGNWIARQILIGGFSAAQKIGWSREKAAKQLCRGLLNGMAEYSNDFPTTASVVMRSAVQCAIAINADLGQTVKYVFSVILKNSRAQESRLDQLVIKVSRSAVEATCSCPKIDATAMKNMLMEVLEGKDQLDALDNQVLKQPTA